MHGLESVSNALEKSREINAPALFVWLKYIVMSSNSRRWDVMFLPLTKLIWSSLTIELMTFCSLIAIAFVSIL